MQRLTLLLGRLGLMFSSSSAKMLSLEVGSLIAWQFPAFSICLICTGKQSTLDITEP